MASKRSRATLEADLQAQQSPYVTYGTPLPALDPDIRDDGSYLPVWKQEVTDEKGRKRLHGAFTGGFSAGYFNTVGSKEGWTPSSFVSSRSNRGKDGGKSQQRPEDFMDEEDLVDAEEAKILRTADPFAGLGSDASGLANTDLSMNPSMVNDNTMGMKLLRTMGWREGQGIGSRSKAGGDSMNGGAIGFTRKVDKHGLGSERDPSLSKPDRLSKDLSETHTNKTAVPGNSNGAKDMTVDMRTRGGFGVGILNGEDSDGEDPYTLAPQLSYNRVLGGEKKKKQKNSVGIKSTSNPTMRSKPVFISRKKTDAKGAPNLRRGHDGRLPLDGFDYSLLTDALAAMLPQDTQGPPIEIPSGWRSSKAKSAEPASRTPNDTGPTTNLNPRSRAALLGEEPLPSKSVFDYLSPAARARLVTATSNEDLPPARNEAAQSISSEKPSDAQSLVPPLAKEVAVVALGRGTGGWMPYMDAPSKRERYMGFLRYHAGLSEPVEMPKRGSGMQDEDWVKEMHEFAHAAVIFKPMSGAIASRFTSSTGAAKSGESSIVATDQGSQEARLSTTKGKSAAEEAAEIGMYGHLTRSMDNWYPSRLLCKRFNIKPPAHVQLNPEDNPAQSGGEARPMHSTALPQKRLELVGKSDMDQLKTSRGDNFLGKMKTFRSSGTEGGIMDDQDEPKPNGLIAPTSPARIEAIEEERPSEAVFKAVFGSDSEDG